MYRITFTPSSKKALLKLPRIVQKRIISSLKRIRIRPEAHVIRLVDEKAYKLRVGDYRVILDLIKNDLIVLVLKLGHRKNIYKK